MTYYRFWRFSHFGSLRKRLLFWFLLMSLLPLLFLGGMDLLAARQALTDQAFAALTATEAFKAQEIERWLADRRGDISFARNLVVVRGSSGVDEGLPTLIKFKADPTHPAYVEAFSRAEGVLASFARDISGEGEALYHDIMLVDLAGDVLFALDERSVRTNIFVTGEVDSALFESGQQGVYVDDIRANPIHNNELHLRVAAPIEDSEGVVIGIIVLEAKVDALNAIMEERTGLGQSGETYLVGQDKLFRSESRFASELGLDTTQLNPAVLVDTVASRSGLEGGSDAQIINDYRGLPVFSSWGFVEVQTPTKSNPAGIRWAMMAEIDEAEVNQPIVNLAWITITLVLLAGVLVTGATASVSRSLATPIQHVAEVARSVASGDLSQRAKVNSGDEIEDLAQAFNTMTVQINRTLETVVERTRKLEIIAVLSERLSAILEVDSLLTEMVNLVKTRFEYYHAHVYLLDKSGQTLQLTAGAGQVGVQLKAQGHNIKLDTPTSLVARAARTAQVVQVDNVREAKDWLPNPLLPNTYAEMAIPIILEDQVVGVLDVQEDTIAGLDEADANVLRSLANQVAIAIRNARLFAEVQAALADARAVQEHYIEQAWNSGRIKQQIQPYLYQSDSATTALAEDMLTQVEQQALLQTKPAMIDLPSSTNSGDHQAALVAPVKFADRVIGILQLHQEATSSKLTWSDQDIAFIETILDQVAQTAENLRLFEETQQQVSYERLMGEITQKIRQAPNLEILSKIAAETLSEALDVAGGTVSLRTRSVQHSELQGGNDHV